MITIVQFIQTYGYPAVFVGAIFEGESILILGGLSAYELYLSFPLVVFFALLGAIVGDWAFFFIGRHKRDFLLRKFPKLYKLASKSHAFVENRPRLSSFLMRFMYGFRHVVPMSIGMSRIPAAQFMIWNALGAMSWAFTITGLGYLVGEAFEAVLGNIRHYEFRIIVFVIIGVAVFSVISRMVRLILRKKIGEVDSGNKNEPA